MVAKGLANEGHQVYVVAEASSFSDRYSKSIMAINGFSNVLGGYLVCPKTRPLWIVNDLVSMCLSFLSSIRYIKVVRPNIVFTHKLAGLGAVLAAKLLGVPSVYVVRGYQHDCFNSEKIIISPKGVMSCQLEKCDFSHVFRCARVYRGKNRVLGGLQFPFSIYSCFVLKVRQLAISKATVIVAISKAVKKSLQTIYPQNVIVKIYNPMEIPKKSPTSVQHDPFGRFFVYVGRLAPSKGISILLYAFKQVHQRYPLCRLAIIGSGPELHNLKTLTSKLELDSAVTFFGHLPSDEVLKFLKSSGFSTVVPSLWEEAFGRVVIESMTVGVPVIASKMGGMTELISDKETGLLVNPGDVVSLVDSMDELINKKTLFENISFAASQNAKLFSVTKITSEYSDLFKNIMNR